MSAEFRIVRGALKWGVIVAGPAGGLMFLLRGPEAALSVLLAAGIVLANTALGAFVSASAAKISTVAAAAVSLPSFFARMAGVIAALATLSTATFIDLPVFALAFAAGVIGVQAMESVRWLRTPWIALTFLEERS